MKKIFLILFFAVSAFAQNNPQQSNVTGMKVLGNAVAAQFGRWQASVSVGNGTTGVSTLSVDGESFVVPAGMDTMPLTTSTPILLDDGPNSETVTPSSVNCSMGSGICNFTATFTKTHKNNFKLRSGTNGLQEAINEMTQTGGTVLVTPDWKGLTSYITSAIGSTTVSILDTRAGGEQFYTWNGANYAISFGVTATGGVALTTNNINNVRLCYLFPGATMSIKLSACIADLPATGGTADARGLEGAQSFSTDPFTGITKPVLLMMPSGTITTSISVTMPSNVTMYFGQGSVLTVGGSTTFTVNGHVDGTLDKHFIVNGTLVLSNQIAYPEWFGAIANGSTDNAAAIQATINAFTNKTNPYGGTIGPANGGWATIRFGAGIYLTKSGVTITKSGLHLIGVGYSSTIWRFQPTSGPAIAITWDGGEEIHDTGIEDMTIDATGSSNGVVKTALKPVDISGARFRDIVIRDFSDTSHSSKCVELHGRDTQLWSNVQFFCNQSLDIQADPYAANEGLDVVTFENDLFLAIDNSNVCVLDKPVINITATDAQLTNVSFDHFDFICGSYSVYWTASTSKGGSNNVSFAHGRNEQGVVPNWAFYIAPAQNILGLQFEDITIESATKGGWYLRNISNGVMTNNNYGASASVAAVDADGTVFMGYHNNNWNTHTPGVYTAFNGWCGIRSEEDALGATFSTGGLILRPCTGPNMLLETVPAGVTYNITAATCSGSLATYTTSANAFGPGGQIKIINVLPAGLRGTYDVVSATATTVVVVNDQCPLTYTSGGAAALTYGPPSYVSTAVVTSDQLNGDLGLRSDGTKIALGFSGTSVASFNSGGLQFYASDGTTAKAYFASLGSITTDHGTNDLQIRTDASKILMAYSGTSSFAFLRDYLQFYASDGTTVKAYIGSRAGITSGYASNDLQIRTDASKILLGYGGTSSYAFLQDYLQLYATDGTTAEAYIGTRSGVLSNWTTNDLQIRSDSSAIRFGFNGTERQFMPNGGGIILDNGSGTPVGGAGTIGIGTTTQAPGSGDCPIATIGGFPVLGCWVITVGGSGRSFPFF